MIRVYTAISTWSSSSSSYNLKKSMITVMSSSTTSLHGWYHLPCLHTFLYFIFFAILFYVTSVSCSPTQLPSTDLCSKIVSESTPTSMDFTTSNFLRFQNGYFRGGGRILNPNSPQDSPNFLKNLWFRTENVYETGVKGVFKVEGSINLRNPEMFNFAYNYTYGQSHYPRVIPPWLYKVGSMSFKRLRGFWSESSGKLCMVGLGSAYSKEGNLLLLSAVFKLNYVHNSSIETSLVSGSLESLSSVDDSNYFEPISIWGFTQMNYKYTLISKEFDNGCDNIPQSLSMSSESDNNLCSILSRRWTQFELKYASDCDSAKNCTPFGGRIGYSPRFMSLNAIQCSEDNQRLRVLVEFPNITAVEYQYYQPFNPNATLVGEGLWDEKKNQLCVVACQILNMTDSLAHALVGDCSVRLCLRFPAIRSIRDRSSIVGEIWSKKAVNDSGYFDRIMYRIMGRSSENPIVGVSGLKYEYTKIDRVRKLCPAKTPVKNKGAKYPDGNSYDMRFDMSVTNSKGRYGWGYSVPLSVGDQFYEQDLYSLMPTANSVDHPANSSNIGPLNISYNIDLTLQPFSGSLNSPYMREEISAEGIYDTETGSLCMVGCKRLGSNNQTWTNDSMDCEILVNFQFPSSNSMNNEGYIKGSIESTRKISDPLHFERLELTSSAFVETIARQLIWRMDLETIMVLISNTLACVFVVLQLFYVKKHPDMLLFTSLVMLGILTLGYMIPLVLNFEALFLKTHNPQNVLLGSRGWVEANEVIVRVITMVAFLLQCRLLQLTWSAQLGNKIQKNLWAAEKKALCVSLPLYIAGGLIALSVNWKNNNSNNGLVKVPTLRADNYQLQHSLWGDLKSYGGLVLDGFLLPQILLNIFWNSSEKPLSRSFYIGTTFVRLLPHAYDLYRAHSHVSHFEGSYIYANPGADFYSTAWDVIIPCGGLLFATAIYLQQRFGGRCIVPQRFRPSDQYEKVPVVSNE